MITAAICRMRIRVPPDSVILIAQESAPIIPRVVLLGERNLTP
jgi:hypothetical protein